MKYVLPVLIGAIGTLAGLFIWQKFLAGKAA